MRVASGVNELTPRSRARMLRETGAINDTLERARHYGQRAIDALGGIGGGPAKAALVEAVEFAIARAY